MARFSSRSGSRVLYVGAAAIFLLLLLGSAYGSGDRFGPLRPAVDVQNRHTGRLMADPDVVGTAVGLTGDGRPAVKVFVKRVGVAGLPAQLEGFPVDVEVTGEFVALPVNGRGAPAEPDARGKPGNRIDPTATFPRPVPIGISTGNEGECSAGTIGARVKGGGFVYALSNNHVYALENRATSGTAALQPGRYDTQCSIDPSDEIGYLDRFVDIDFSGAPNLVDAAIAISDTARLGVATPGNEYTPSSTIDNASVSQLVKKYGRTTSLTHGSVDAVNATINVGYSSGTALFVEQIVVVARRGAFIKAGDSGSLLVTESGNVPVGLLFAGDSSGKYGIANPIGQVLDALGVSIDDGRQ